MLSELRGRTTLSSDAMTTAPRRLLRGAPTIIAA
jgi:hypothetical protein